MSKVLAALRGFLSRARAFLAPHWKRFRTLPRWSQMLVGLIGIALIIALFSYLHAETPKTNENLRFVTLRTIAELSGGETSGSVLGTVRARAEARMLAQVSGTVKQVHTKLGARVPAGFVIAELENSSEQAALLQAEGAYDAAIAAQTSVSLTDSTEVARNTYRSAFSTIDASVETDIGAFFGEATPYGPDLLINPIGTDFTALPREKTRIDTVIKTWRTKLPAISSSDTLTLLTEAETNVRDIQLFVESLADAASRTNSNATAAQLSSLASARADIAGVLSSLASARAAYRSGSTLSTASVNAGVKGALGTLRLAQSALEKTRVRAPLGGTVNFLSLRVADYVSALTHVATVAENGALEIVAYVSEDDRGTLTIGSTLSIEDRDEGVITSISPALDPVTRQIEIRVAASASPNLVNGQSVRLELPNALANPEVEAVVGSLYLPLASVKLRTDDRVVFTLSEDGHLKALAVETGDVRGDKIEVLTPFNPTLVIVSDARGLAEGEKVNVAP